MLTKERSVGMYKLSAYFLGRTTSDLPLDLVLPIVFLLIVYFMVGLKLSFASFSLTMLTVFLSVVAAQGLGLTIGAAFMDVRKATTVASIIVMAFMLSAGFFIQGLGLTIGAAFMDVRKATTVASIIVMAFMLSAGFFIQGLGLTIGAAFMDVRKATTVASIIVMAFMLSAGFFIQKVPSFMVWVRYISFNYHTYRLLLKIQYGCPAPTSGSSSC
ncbi:hypothetical protein I3760_15G018700 [Carya illinoinensis]|nr:hypothetical protein I3760_15G018700 [Carya illinoinensis]